MKAKNSQFNGISPLRQSMLTRDATVAFNPEAKVSTLAISDDGMFSVWSEGDGLVCFSKNSDDNSESDLIFWKADGKVTGSIISNNLIYILDEIYGVNCLNTQLEPVWKLEIEGGGFEFRELSERLAVVDSLGRLVIVSKDGEKISLVEDYSSIAKIEVCLGNIITAHENGEVRVFDGNKTIWSRPKRGDIGESITHIAYVNENKLLIGREGYALVPGEEEALEIEVWDYVNNGLILRKEIDSRLTSSTTSDLGPVLGFSSGRVSQLNLENIGNEKEITTIFDSGYPIKTLNYSSKQIIFSSWFFIYGVLENGETWKVEHKGIPELIAVSLNGDVCLFAGEDQNDWTSTEPIGRISLNGDLTVIEESELTLWFSQEPNMKKHYSNDFYSQEEVSLHLSQKEMEELSNSEFNNLKESIDDLIGALDVSSSTDKSESTISGTLDIDTDELLSQLDDELEKIAMLPEQSILDELNSTVVEIQVPIANAGDDQSIVSDDDNTAIVTLDATSSFDPQNRIIQWSWIDQSGKEISNLAKLNVRLNIGTFRFELRICDSDGNWSSDSLLIKII